MKNLKRRIGCGLWLVWLLLATFAGEWLLLWFALQTVPQEQLLPAVTAIIIMTIVGGWIAVYLRVQRRIR